MRVEPAVSLKLGYLCAAAVLLGASPASAQTGMVTGVVSDSAGTPIRDADVGIVALRKLTRTDAKGRFVLTDLPRGKAEISVRRLSYRPHNIELEITDIPIDTLRITLMLHPALLTAVAVTGKETRHRQQIEDFYRRRVQGAGQYITREQIEARWGGNPSDLLRTTPGIRLVRSANGGYGVRFPNTSLSRFDCAPMIWIDGQKVSGLEIDDIPLRDVEGIELYNGPSTTPMQFSQAQSSRNCGTIVVWSRPAQYQIYDRSKP